MMRALILASIIASVVFGKVTCEDSANEVLFGDDYFITTTITDEHQNTTQEILDEIWAGAKDDVIKAIWASIDKKRDELISTKKCVKVEFGK